VSKLYYLRDYTDEVMPCAPTLDAWAQWLAAPDENWSRPEAAKPGETFVCDLMERLPNISATLKDGAWTTPAFDAGAGFQGASFFAVAEGQWWDIEQSGGDVEAALCEYATDGSDGEAVDLVVCRDLPAIMVRFEVGAGGPRLVEEGPVQ
jgi:hypothetical protein